MRNIIPSHVNCIYIRQAEPLGLGHAVHCGAPLVHPEEHVAILLPDDLIDGYQKGCLQQMNEVYQRTGHSVIALEQVSWDDVHQYGVVKPKDEHVMPLELEGIVEKPKREDAPSNWTVVGRYILSGKIMQLLEKTPRGAGGEIQLTDGISELLKSETILGMPFSGKRFDCGSKAGFLAANLHFGLGLLKRGGR